MRCQAKTTTAIPAKDNKDSKATNSILHKANNKEATATNSNSLILKAREATKTTNNPAHLPKTTNSKAIPHLKVTAAMANTSTNLQQADMTNAANPVIQPNSHMANNINTHLKVPTNNLAPQGSLPWIPTLPQVKIAASSVLSQAALLVPMEVIKWAMAFSVA